MHCLMHCHTLEYNKIESEFYKFSYLEFLKENDKKIIVQVIDTTLRSSFYLFVLSKWGSLSLETFSTINYYSIF